MPEGKVAIHTTPDTEYGLTLSNGRFLVPSELVDRVTLPMLIHGARLEVSIAERSFRQYVMQAGKDLILANRKRGWEFRGDMGVEVDLSSMQIDFHPFGTTSNDIVPAADQHTLLTRNVTACIIKMYFVAPKVATLVTSNAELSEADGFVESPPAPGDDIVAV